MYMHVCMYMYISYSWKVSRAETFGIGKIIPYHRDYAYHVSAEKFVGKLVEGGKVFTCESFRLNIRYVYIVCL